MHVLFVSASQEPFSKGPAAEICAALPKGLGSLDVTVSVLTPLYQNIDPQTHSLARRLTKIDVSYNGNDYACELYTGRTVSGVSVLFVGHETLFHEVTSLDDGDDEATATRAQVFAKAVIGAIAMLDTAVDVVHGHGWVGATALSALREAGSDTPQVLTVHDRDGRSFPASTGLEDPLRNGAQGAARVTVGSSRYGRELQSTLGLSAEVVGIPDGIDAAHWNPITDSHLPARFDPVDLTGKRRCKAELQRQLGLPVRPEVPLLAVDGNLGGDDGLALLVKVASELLRNDVQFAVFTGAGEDGALVAAYEELWDRWPDRIQVRTEADSELRHRVYGGADLLLVGDQQAPSGRDAMRAHRYGVLPIVHDTGALADVVVDCDAKLQTGSGFLFAPFDAEALLGTVRRAFAAYSDLQAFAALSQRVMRIDHSWDRAARLYDRLYASLFEEEEAE
ncbi:MAG: glycogen/starch synthase [Myxococcota bacterium]